MKINQAPDTPDSLAIVMRLRREAQQWLASRGTDQWRDDWPDTKTMISGFAHALRDGETWFASNDDGTVVGAVTLNHNTDTGLWTDEEKATALFIHRLTIIRESAKQGIGDTLLEFAEERARIEGKPWLRLDAWTTNVALHRYYERHGFRLVRIVPHHHSPSAACFERAIPNKRNDAYISHE